MADLDLTKRQQEIFDFIKQLLGQVRLPAHGAGHRQGDRPDLLLDRARAPRQPREGRAAAARPDQAARDRAAGRQGQAGGRGRDRAAGLPVVGQVAAGSAVLAEENIEEYVQVPAARGRRRGRVHPHRHRRLDDQRRHPRRRPRGGPLAGDRAATARSSWRSSATRRPRSSASSRRSDHVRLQPENDPLEPILQRRGQGARQGGRRPQEGLMSTAVAERPAARPGHCTARPVGTTLRGVARPLRRRWPTTLEQRLERRLGGPAADGSGRVPRVPRGRCASGTRADGARRTRSGPATP